MYLPAGQSVQIAAPAPLNLPSGHTVHASLSLDLSPFSMEYFPAVQFTHTPTKVYVPFGHRLVGIAVGRSVGEDVGSDEGRNMPAANCADDHDGMIHNEQPR